MRRVGKTYFLFQVLRDRLASGVPRDRLVYFNFADERLAEFQSEDLGEVIEIYDQQYPDYGGRETVVGCFNEMQMVSGWERFVD